MSSKTVVWLGDEDASQQVIEQYGYRFVKGEPVSGIEGNLAKFEGNPFFKLGNEKGEVIESTPPPARDPEEGTEEAAIKRQLDARGISYRSNASLESLRGALAKAEEDARKEAAKTKPEKPVGEPVNVSPPVLADPEVAVPQTTAEKAEAKGK